MTTDCPEGERTNRVSVVVPVRNAEGTIEETLGSIAAQTYGRDRLEVLVFDGSSTDGTREAVSRFSRSHPDLSVELLPNPLGSVPPALNSALERATGEYWLRVDAHSALSREYISICLRELNERPDAVAVAGRLVSVGQGRLGRAISEAQSAWWGVGGNNFRTVTSAASVDTAAFPVVKMSAMRTAGRFDEALVRNQDDEHSARLRRSGEIWITPDVEIRYRTRDSFTALARQYFGYGYYKPSVMVRSGYRLRIRHLVPAFLVLAHLRLALRGVKPLYRFSVAHIAGLLVASRSLRSESFGHWALAVLAAQTMHLSYGAGFILGIRRLVTGSRAHAD